MSRPNILFITLDQWRGDCLGSAGHPVVETPNLDRLAAEGVRFTSHYAQSAPCGPSRASLLTGTYQHVHRSVQNGAPLDARFTNVALEARAAGYDPLLFGHTDTTVDPRTVPDDDPRLEDYEGSLPGFRVVLDIREDRTVWYRWLEERGHDISDPDRFLRPRTDMATPAGRGASWPPPPFAADETETAFLVGEVIDELERLEGDGRPWFVHASIYRPHPPVRRPRAVQRHGGSGVGIRTDRRRSGRRAPVPGCRQVVASHTTTARLRRPPAAACHLLRDDGRGGRPGRPAAGGPG